MGENPRGAWSPGQEGVEGPLGSAALAKAAGQLRIPSPYPLAEQAQISFTRYPQRLKSRKFRISLPEWNRSSVPFSESIGRGTKNM